MISRGLRERGGGAAVGAVFVRAGLKTKAERFSWRATGSFEKKKKKKIFPDQNSVEIIPEFRIFSQNCSEILNAEEFSIYSRIFGEIPKLLSVYKITSESLQN